jgi:hypothetical protein
MASQIAPISPIASQTDINPGGKRRRRSRLAQGIALALVATAASLGALPAKADNWHYRGNNIRTFTHYDYNAWRHGYWWRGNRGGRSGWWWYAGGYWYPYPRPIYPFPNPYIPPTVIIQPVPNLPPPPQPQQPPPTQVWYYCPNPQGYYPYIAQCYSGWQAVPATPQ